MIINNWTIIRYNIYYNHIIIKPSLSLTILLDLLGSLLTNQYFMESRVRFFFVEIVDGQARFC